MSDRVHVGILISGRGTNMKALIEGSRLLDAPYEIVLVASNNPEAPGLAIARERGVPTWAESHKGMTRSEFDRRLDRQARDAGVEVIALAGYMRLLSPEFIASWTGRILNIHPSLLPLYKGIDTHARAIAAGDEFAGCSVHIVTEALDAGPVMAQVKVPILAGDTPEILAERVLTEENKLYPRALAQFATSLISRHRLSSD